MNKIQFSIPQNKRYLIPQSLVIVKHRRKILVIASEMANWIVLSNKKQLSFLYLLQSQSVNKAIQIFNGAEEDIKNVLLQLEARHFESNFPTCYDDAVIHAHLYLTNACNLHCPHCYMSAGTKLPNELSTDEIILFLQNFHNYGGKEVILSGGEICMRSDFSQIIKAAYEQHLFLRILTNGTMWSPTEIEALSPFIGEVQISIDGYCEEENAKVRGSDNFQKALRAADCFVNHNVLTKIAITPMYNSGLKDKIHEYVKFVKFLVKKYEEKPFRVVIANELLDGRDVKLSSQQKRDYQRIMTTINKECLGANMYSAFIKARKKGVLSTNCAFGDITLSADGTIYFCNRLPSSNLRANIRTDSFENIWAMSQWAKDVSNVNNLVPCKTCELKFICGGGCRIERVTELHRMEMDKTTKEELHCECDIIYKKKLYDKMIDLNELIFH